MFPKYLKPVFDRDAYGPLSKAEKAVRFLIFVPIAFVFMIPGIGLLLVWGVSGGIGAMQILVDDTGTMTWLKIAMFVIAPIMFLCGMWVRKYCLPFD